MKYLLWYLAIGAVVAIAIEIRRRLIPPALNDIDGESSQTLWLGLLALTLVWPLGLALFACELSAEKRPPRELSRHELAFEVEPSEIGRSITIEEVERLEMVDDPLGAAPRLPFGHLNHVWEQFKAAVQPGMELHTFIASYPGWGGRSICTKSGYVIVIDGVPGRYHLTDIVSRPVPENAAATSDKVARFLRRCED